MIIRRWGLWLVASRSAAQRGPSPAGPSRSTTVTPPTSSPSTTPCSDSGRAPKTGPGVHVVAGGPAGLRISPDATAPTPVRMRRRQPTRHRTPPSRRDRAPDRSERHRPPSEPRSLSLRRAIAHRTRAGRWSRRGGRLRCGSGRRAGTWEEVDARPRQLACRSACRNRRFRYAAIRRLRPSPPEPGTGPRRLLHR
jgi:hypothetical protein